ncbi:MAG: SusC/RagA family TonB-linked outer membrane protein, partial [Chitinophagaceae bacterium]|nr:SusC/RagA family TonB-linked outer membrane protein [Chitinophagaceae bacterium]
GLGWIFSETDWIKRSLSWLSFGKIRGSYGTAGNDQIGDYQYQSSNSPVNVEILYQGVGGLRGDYLSNPYLQWEDIRKLQGGIDLGFWKDRLLLNLGYAVNRSSNQLIPYVLPAVTGYTNITVNFPATMQNTSLEFMLNMIIVKTSNLKWTSSVNLTIPRNKVVAFPDIENTSYAGGRSGVILGQPNGVIVLHNFLGVDPLTGRYLVANGKEDGTPIQFPQKDPYVLINPNAGYYYGGWQNAITFKGVQMDFLFQFVRQMGNREFDYWNGTFGAGFFERGMGNQALSVFNRWQKPGDIARVAPYSADPAYVYRASLYPLNNTDAFYSFDASYIRLKNCSLSWQFPQPFLKKLGLQSGRIYSQGQNLFTITNYTGLDPETKSVTRLPPLRTWTLGIQIGL